MARATEHGDRRRLARRLVPRPAGAARARDRGDPRRRARHLVRRHLPRHRHAGAGADRPGPAPGGERVRAEDPASRKVTRRHVTRVAQRYIDDQVDVQRHAAAVRRARRRRRHRLEPAGAESRRGSAALDRDVAGPRRESPEARAVRTAPLGFSDVTVNGEPVRLYVDPRAARRPPRRLDRRRRADRGRHARAERRRAHVPVRRHGDAAGGDRARLRVRDAPLAPAAADGERPPPRCAPATSRSASARAGATTRCACWRTRSTACSTGSRTRSRASAASSPTPRTSCARR